MATLSHLLRPAHNVLSREVGFYIPTTGVIYNASLN